MIKMAAGKKMSKKKHNKMYIKKERHSKKSFSITKKFFLIIFGRRF